MDSEEKGDYGNNKNDGDDRDDKNLRKEHSKTEGKISSEILNQKLKENKKEEHSLCGGYKSRLRSTRKRRRKSAQELEKKSLKSYKIKVL